MISDDVLQRAVYKIHACPELAGCIVGYWGAGVCRTIGYPYCATPNSENVAVIIEEVALPPQTTVQPATAIAAPPPPQVKGALNSTKLWPELIGAGASCALFGVSAAGVVGGVAGEIPTGGASTLLIVASWGGLIAGGIQCANGVVRVGQLVANWDTDSLDQWDNNDTYKYTLLFVDFVGVAGGVATLPHQAKNLWAVVARLRKLKGNPELTMEALKRMNATERFKVISEAFKDASKTPEGAQALVAAARETKQIGAATLQQTSRLSVNHSRLLKAIIHKETVARLNAGLKDIFFGVAGIAVSGTPSEWTGSGSGFVNEAGKAIVTHLIDAGEPNIK